MKTKQKYAYYKMRQACREINNKQNTNGRSLKNMSKLKQLEYYWLQYYANNGILISIGHKTIIYRLRKNLQYRKKLITKIKEDKSFFIL